MSRTLTLSLFVVVVVPVSAQSLADLAREEVQRRQTLEHGRRYTNADLAVLPAPKIGPLSPKDRAYRMIYEP